MRSAMSMGTPREHGSTMLVAGLAASFGVGLIQVTALVYDVFSDGLAGATNLLYSTAMVFILLSMYVAAVVTANTFGTIVAGRTRTIALLRLVGASAREVRRSVAREGLMVGAASGVVGLVVGIGGSALARTVGVVSGGGTRHRVHDDRPDRTAAGRHRCRHDLGGVLRRIEESTRGDPDSGHRTVRGTDRRRRSSSHGAECGGDRSARRWRVVAGIRCAGGVGFPRSVW